MALHKAARRNCLAAVIRLLRNGALPKYLDDKVWVTSGSNARLQFLAFAQAACFFELTNGWMHE